VSWVDAQSIGKGRTSQVLTAHSPSACYTLRRAASYPP
jgi:hypothetical protein